MIWSRMVLLLTLLGASLTLGCNGQSAQDEAKVSDAELVWESDYDAALAAANKRDTLIVADFYAT